MIHQTINWKNLVAGYDAPVIHHFEGSVAKGDVVGIVGRNGAGKTSFLKALMGLNKIYSGSINYDDENITLMACYQKRRAGISYQASENMVLPKLSVAENLQMDHAINPLYLEQLQKNFPILIERADNKAGNLSGGEKKILAFARTLSTKSDFIFLDEPTEGVAQGNIGLMADMVKKRAKVTKKSNVATDNVPADNAPADNVGFLIVDQNINFLFSCATHLILVENGKIHKQDVIKKFNRNSVLTFLKI